MPRDAHQRRLLRATGSVRSRDPLVHVLYMLRRDYLQFGEVYLFVERILQELREDDRFTDGDVARSCIRQARRLRRGFRR